MPEGNAVRGAVAGDAFGLAPRTKPLILHCAALPYDVYGLRALVSGALRGVVGGARPLWPAVASWCRKTGRRAGQRAAQAPDFVVRAVLDGRHGPHATR